VIRVGLRLIVNGGKDAAVRLAIIVVAVAVGVSLLLMALAGINAVNSQNARYAWLNVAYSTQTTPTSASTGANGTASADPLWWLLQPDHVDGQIIGRIDVAASGATSPIPPGIPNLPGPGEFYASPAFTELLASTPAGELGDRYPGRQIGTIGPEALPGPDSLIIIVGHDPGELSQWPGVDQVTTFSNAKAGACDCYSIGINTDGIYFILAVAAGALLFPVLIFIAAASRLSAARREERFAAMRLIGATPRQVSVIATVESTVAAIGGVAAGFGLFFLLRGSFATINLTGDRFFIGDLSLSLVDIVIVAVGVPAAAAVAARVALRRVQISPLGVSRRVTPPAPRAYRMIPLLAGIAALAIVVVVGKPATTPGQIAAFFPGFLLIMVGLIVAGPWLTMLGSRIVARRSGRPAALIAARRLSDNPQAAFRAISGLVLALFVTSATVAVITTWDANRGTSSSDTAANNTLIAQFDNALAGGPTSVAPLPDAVLTELHSIPGVQDVTTIHTNPLGTTVSDGNGQLLVTAGLVSCDELDRTPSLGRCEAGAEVAAITSSIWEASHDDVWSAAAITPERLQDLPALSILVSTDGSSSAIDQARTLLQTTYPDQWPPSTIAEDNAQNSKLNDQYQRLADMVILFSLPIAGCSLAASVVGGLNDRKRPFSLLRLTGAPLGVLRRVVAVESAVPLLLIAVVATTAGLLAADLFLRAQLDYTLRPPGTQFYLIVVVGLTASLGIIASTLPWLRRITGPETARNE
jgi:FtsX-like permease family